MIAPATAVAVAPERDSHQEVTATASDDLSKFSGQALPFFNQSSLAKLGERYTTRTPSFFPESSCWWLAGGVPEEQSVSVGDSRYGSQIFCRLPRIVPRSPSIAAA